MSRNQPPVVVIEKRNNGCLITAITFLLFGWLGLAAMAAWKLLVWTWNASVALMRWTWQATVASVKWTGKASAALTARYGWRGWAVVGVIFVALAILGALTGQH